MTEFTREVRFEPGYDYAEEDKDKPWGERRGVHGMNIRFLLHGDEGTIQFLVYTQWLPSWVKTEPDAMFTRILDITDVMEGGQKIFPPMAADIGFHWDKLPPHEPEDDWYHMQECDVRPGGQCYYDGSSLQAERVFALLLKKGHEAVWTYMEEHYQHTKEYIDGHEHQETVQDTGNETSGGQAVPDERDGICAGPDDALGSDSSVGETP